MSAAAPLCSKSRVRELRRPPSHRLSSVTHTPDGTAVLGGCSARAYALSRKVSSEIAQPRLPHPLLTPGSPSLTSHMMSRPDLVTPAFCVLPADTCTTSVLSMGRRRGVVIPLPQV